MTQADPALAVQATIVEALKRQLDAVAAAVARRPALELGADASARVGAPMEAEAAGAEAGPRGAPAVARAKRSPSRASAVERRSAGEAGPPGEPASAEGSARPGSPPRQGAPRGAGRASPWSAPLRLGGSSRRAAVGAPRREELRDPASRPELEASAAAVTGEDGERGGDEHVDVEWGELPTTSAAPAGASSSSTEGADEPRDRPRSPALRGRAAAASWDRAAAAPADAVRPEPAKREVLESSADSAEVGGASVTRASARASAWSRPVRLGPSKSPPAARKATLPQDRVAPSPAVDEAALAEDGPAPSRAEPEARASLSSFGATASPSPFPAAGPGREAPRARASEALGLRRAPGRFDDAPAALLAPAPSLDDELDSLGELEERLADVLEGVLFEMGVEP